MVHNLTQQILAIRKEQGYRFCEWVNLQGLVDLVTTHLSRANSSPVCHTISLLGRGSFNTVYQLVFSDGIQLAASISNSKEDKFNAQARLSEIETMKFVRESGLYPDIPVPKVHGWDVTFNNPACAPYIIMDVVQGDNLQGLKNDERLFGLDTLPHAQQLSIVKALAKLQASLSRPVPFDKIGSITADAVEGSQLVGPLITFAQICLGGPFRSVDELWRSCLERGIVNAVQEWCSFETDQLPLLSPDICTPQTFTELYQLLSSLIPQFTIPRAYSQLVLHHPDLALRNIFFDKESLLSDEPKITGVIDWDGAQILPLMLTAIYPDDLRTVFNDPYSRPRCPGQHWSTVPFDWTSIGDRSQIPEAFDRNHVSVDYMPRATTMVRRFYLRTYFSACFAEQLHQLHGDTNLARAMLFADAPYYLKFHETVSGEPGDWFFHGDWIRETYWRLRGLPDRGTADQLVTGPNAYRKLVGPVVRDLGIFEESPYSQNTQSIQKISSLSCYVQIFAVVPASPYRMGQLYSLGRRFTRNIEEDFKITSGSLGECHVYAFGRKEFKHLSCPECATPLFGRDKNNGAAINVRCLDGIELDSLSKKGIPDLVILNCPD